jgi:hypothetical protein
MSAYAAGFLAKCAEHGVDPAVLLGKWAGGDVTQDELDRFLGTLTAPEAEAGRKAFDKSISGLGVADLKSLGKKPDFPALHAKILPNLVPEAALWRRTQTANPFGRLDLRGRAAYDVFPGYVGWLRSHIAKNPTEWRGWVSSRYPKQYSALYPEPVVAQ